MIFVNDICGILCVILSWCLILFAQYSVVTCIILPEQDTLYKTVNFIIFQLLLFLATVSHLKCVFTDPGSVSRGSATRAAIESLGLSEDTVLYKCQKCCAIKPKRAHHCSVCKRCILKMDHHCPFVNNCIGYCNQKYFVLFTFYIALVSTYTLVITVFHLINCIKNDWQFCESRSVLSLFTSDYYTPVDAKSNHTTPYTINYEIIIIVILIFESLLFAIFTLIMLVSQILSIYHDETGIESLKKEKYSNRCVKNRSFIKRCKMLLKELNCNSLNPFSQISYASNASDFKNYTHYA